MPDLNSNRRVVIVTASRTPEGRPAAAVVEHIEAIIDAFPGWEFLICDEQPSGCAPRPAGDQQRGPVGLPATLAEFARSNVRYAAFQSLESEESNRLVAAWEPWLGVAIDVAGPRPRLSRLPCLGTIAPNKHVALPDASVSIGWIDDDPATGLREDLVKWSLEAAPHSTFAGIAAELDLLASEALVEALRRLDTGGPGITPTPREAESKAQPSWTVRKRLRPRPRPEPSAQMLARRAFGAVKTGLLLAFVHLAAPLRNLVLGRLGRCRVTVLLFHRVSDVYRDSVTVGIEQFQDVLRRLKRHYDVLDLPEFLASRGAPRLRPAVVLTFDDGYEDNLLAAVLLRREGIPCTFFVSTRIVGDGDAAFPHDRILLGHRVPALSWEQVRQMARWGFHFGNHTARHANLGSVSLGEAVDEVSTASADLGRELGHDAPGLRWLAYPYGKPEDINEQVRDRLPSLGVSHCLSAYGGTNPPAFDVSDVRRQNVDCFFSALRLLAAIEGWTPGYRHAGPQPSTRAGLPLPLERDRATMVPRRVGQNDPAASEAVR